MNEKDPKNALMAPLICSVVSFALLTILGAAVMLVPKSRLERDAEALAEGTLFIEINQSALSGDKNNLKIGVYSNDKLIETTTARFLAPRSYK